MGWNDQSQEAGSPSAGKKILSARDWHMPSCACAAWRYPPSSGLQQFRLLRMGLVSAPKQEPSRRRHQHEGDSAKALQRMGASNLPRILGEKHTCPPHPPQPRPHNHVIDQQCNSTLAWPNCALPASSRGGHLG